MSRDKTFPPRGSAPCYHEGEPMSLRLLLTISGVLEGLVGVLALISPALVVSLLLGAPMDSLG